MSFPRISLSYTLKTCKYLNSFVWNLKLGRSYVCPQWYFKPQMAYYHGARKSTQTFSGLSFSIMHQKVRFPATPVVGRNFLTPGHPGGRVRNVCGKSGPNSLCLCCFSSLILPLDR